MQLMEPLINIGFFLYIQLVKPIGVCGLILERGLHPFFYKKKKSPLTHLSASLNEYKGKHGI